jgi:hypothetical protein
VPIEILGTLKNNVWKNLQILVVANCWAHMKALILIYTCYNLWLDNYYNSAAFAKFPVM